jgi:hypothetical protein
MGLKVASGLGLCIVVSFIAFVLMKQGSSRSRLPPLKGGSARLPCLANNSCPVGQKCSGGYCTEGFMAPIMPSTDMSSCNAKECKGINAPCARSSTPCPEGTFCQNNSCVSITTADQGEAYNQIGMLSV